MNKPDRRFEREAASAFSALEGAEALGVRFVFSLAADYPPDLPAACVEDLERAIGRYRLLISRLLLERAGVAP